MSLPPQPGLVVTRHESHSLLTHTHIVAQLEAIIDAGWKTSVPVTELLKESQYTYLIATPTFGPASMTGMKILGYAFITYEPFEVKGEKRWGVYVGRTQVAGHGLNVGYQLMSKIVADAHQWEREHKAKLFVWFKTFTPFGYGLAQNFLGSTIQPFGTPQGVIFDAEAQAIMAGIKKASVGTAIGDIVAAGTDAKYPYMIRGLGAKMEVVPKGDELARVETAIAKLPAHHVMRVTQLDPGQADCLFCIGTRIPRQQIKSAL